MAKFLLTKKDQLLGKH